MFFDTSDSCDVCEIRGLCIKKRQISKLEDIIGRSEVYSHPRLDSWPLESYLNYFKDILPAKYVCDHVRRSE